MTTVLYILLRSVIAIGGYIVACLAASAFLHVLFLGVQGFGATEIPWIAVGSMILSIPFIALFIGNFSALPAAIVILAAEILGKRDWLYYAIGGAVVGLIVIAMFWQGSLPIAGGLDLSDAGIAVDPMILEPQFYALMIGGGIVGGLAYWLVAGQSAGLLHRHPPEQTGRAKTRRS